MTFTEAAIEILKREGGPLPVRRLAELAMTHHLLSVVGRDPEATMRLRLNEAGVESSELICVGPDLYGLRDGDASRPTANAAPEKNRRKRRRRRGEEERNDARGAETAMESGGNDEEAIGDEHELPTGPLLASTSHHDEMVRSEEHRAVGAELTRREERGRGRRKSGKAKMPRQPVAKPSKAEDSKSFQVEVPRAALSSPAAGAASSPLPRAALAQPVSNPVPTPDQPSQTLLDAALAVLRAADGRSIHVRQLTEATLKWRPTKQAGGEVARALRLALQQEIRSQEALGLRSRVRSLAGGHYAMAERKLDGELVTAERELAERRSKLRDATVQALRRRIVRLAPPAFEALALAAADRLGLSTLELVRRGEGVAYFGGQRKIGLGGTRVLLALRPHEAEISRRAVGELRAGLEAKGFDAGILLAGGRAGEEGLRELQESRAVTVYDGAALAELCLQFGIGVKRAQMPVEYFDIDFFLELSES